MNADNAEQYVAQYIEYNTTCRTDIIADPTATPPVAATSQHRQSVDLQGRSTHRQGDARPGLWCIRHTNATPKRARTHPPPHVLAHHRHPVIAATSQPPEIAFGADTPPFAVPLLPRVPLCTERPVRSSHTHTVPVDRE